VHWEVRLLNARYPCTAAQAFVVPDAATVEHNTMDREEILQQALPVKYDSGTASDPKRKYRSESPFEPLVEQVTTWPTTTSM
jgi:hypothetical protein